MELYGSLYKKGSFSFIYISKPVIDITNIVITRYMKHHNNYD
jgi:hypothetical protein